MTKYISIRKMMKENLRIIIEIMITFQIGTMDTPPGRPH